MLKNLSTVQVQSNVSTDVIKTSLDQLKTAQNKMDSKMKDQLKTFIGDKLAMSPVELKPPYECKWSEHSADELDFAPLSVEEQGAAEEEKRAAEEQHQPDKEQHQPAEEEKQQPSKRTARPRKARKNKK